MSFTLDIWSLIAFGIGFWVLIDGLFFALIPRTMRGMMDVIRAIPEDELRWAGLTSAVIGAVIVFFVVIVPRF